MKYNELIRIGLDSARTNNHNMVLVYDQLNLIKVNYVNDYEDVCRIMHCEIMPSTKVVFIEFLNGDEYIRRTQETIKTHIQYDPEDFKNEPKMY